MTAEQNIETARQMYDAFGRGDVQAILALVTDDVDWSTDAAFVSAPWYGPRQGKDGVTGFFEAIGKTGPADHQCAIIRGEGRKRGVECGIRPGGRRLGPGASRAGVPGTAIGWLAATSHRRAQERRTPVPAGALTPALPGRRRCVYV
jgi:SnoaL-like protein